MNPKYAAKTRKVDDKAFLYEQYWGELKSPREIMKMDCVNCSKKLIIKNMRKFGIPTRGYRYNSDNSVPPYSCFYSDDEAKTDTTSDRRYDENYESQPTEYTIPYTDKTY